MIRRPPRSTQSRSSAASDVYKRQVTSLVMTSPVSSMKLSWTFVPSSPGFAMHSHSSNSGKVFPSAKYQSLQKFATFIILIENPSLPARSVAYIFTSYIPCFAFATSQSHAIAPPLPVATLFEPTYRDPEATPDPPSFDSPDILAFWSLLNPTWIKSFTGSVTAQEGGIVSILYLSVFVSLVFPALSSAR